MVKLTQTLAQLIIDDGLSEICNHDNWDVVRNK